jgi:hypothetical protein
MVLEKVFQGIVKVGRPWNVVGNVEGYEAWSGIRVRARLVAAVAAKVDVLEGLYRRLDRQARDPDPDECQAYKGKCGSDALWRVQELPDLVVCSRVLIQRVA